MQPATLTFAGAVMVLILQLTLLENVLKVEKVPGLLAAAHSMLAAIHVVMKFLKNFDLVAALQPVAATMMRH